MENQDEHDCTRDVGRLINTLSHQLKRQISFPEEESSLTNIQRLVLNYILFQVLKREVYQKDIEKEFQIRRSTATAILQLLERKGFICRETAEEKKIYTEIIPSIYTIAVTIAERIHLFSYRTQKLSSLTPKVLEDHPPGG